MGFETIPPKNIVDCTKNKDCIIVDLRTKEEYEKGHIPKAINIPYEVFTEDKTKLKGYHEVVLYCDRGNTSLLAARELAKLGYEVKNIYGGIHAYRGELEVNEMLERRRKQKVEMFVDCIRKVF